VAPRLRPVADPPPETHPVLEATRQRFGIVPNLFLTLAHNPSLLAPVSRLGAALVDGSLQSTYRELIILRVAWRTSCQYEWAHHKLLGLEAGLSDEQIDAVAQQHLVGWPEIEHRLLAAADDICLNNKVSESNWDAVLEALGESALVESVLLAGFYRMLAGFLNSAEVELDALPLDHTGCA
jgi:4-carboxymuconolactone decarboxylase